jgi:Skp family chaperone for outer membrane proteins
MINMGEEIVRVRGDKQGMEIEVKELRQKLSERIREINERERELVAIKTENITLTNHKNSLEKEIAEMKQLNESHFIKSNIV